jgi:GDPmannose 4,6-dehydratase
MPTQYGYGDMIDGTGLRRILEKAQPDEIYNLTAQSHVKVSFDQPEYTADAAATGTLRLLEVVRDHMGVSGKQVRIYQAGSSEIVRRRRTASERVRALFFIRAALTP